MKILLSLALVAMSFLPAFAQSAPQGFTNVYANHLVDALGNPLASGTISFSATDTSGSSITPRIGTTAQGQIMARQAQAVVTNGVFNINLADVALSSPSFFCYQLTLTDNSTGNVVLGGKDYSCIQPNGASYNLDAYSVSTTPIQAPANATMNGNLSIDGNLSITGNISGNIGTLTTNAVVTNTINAATATLSGALSAATVNGVVNPVGYPGTTGMDLGAAINYTFQNACIAPPTGITPLCTIQVPPGKYTVTTEIVMPTAANGVQDATLIMDGATLTFSGLAYGLSTGIGEDHVFIHGGIMNFASDTACKAGVILAYGSQGAYLEDVRESGCAGDGLLNLGTNVVTLLNSQFRNNLIGVHLLGSPGYASNNVKVLDCILSGNKREGILDGDISQYPVGWPLGNGGTWSTAGSSSPNFNNIYFGNDLELDGSASSTTSDGITNTYPSILLALTNGDQVMGNYHESSPWEGIRLGCNPYADSAYPALYGGMSGPNCGTAKGPSVRGDYFTTAGGEDILLVAVVGATITGNSDQLATTNSCFVNLQGASINTTVNSNQWQATNEFCIGGAAVSVDTWSAATGGNLVDTDLNTQGSKIFFNSTPTTSFATGVQALQFGGSGPATPYNPTGAVGSNPFCNPAYHNGYLMIDTINGLLWICTADSVLTAGQTGAGSTTDGNSTWQLVTGTVR